MTLSEKRRDYYTKHKRCRACFHVRYTPCNCQYCAVTNQDIYIQTKAKWCKYYEVKEG